MSEASPKQLGIIGLGQFGQLVARHLRDHFAIVAADADNRRPETHRLGIRLGTLAEAIASDIVILAVPMQALEATLIDIAPHLSRGTLVADVCSVKAMPVAWMRKHLPAHVEFVGTHPMFGPQSAADSLAGQQVVLCPERTERGDSIRGFLEQLGLEVIITDPETHDRQCAQTQAAAQYIGRALRSLELADAEIRTPAAALLGDIARLVGSDSWELFAAIQNLNPYAADMRARLRARFDALEARLGASTEH